MNNSAQRIFDDASTDGLDGQWADILRAGTYDGENYTPDDLDSMVTEYQRRGDGDKSPVALGLPPSKSNPGTDQPVGRIDALRKAGNSVQAKFSGIDPRVEQLHGRGKFPKKSVLLKRSPEGISLQRVGLISPIWEGMNKRDDATPSVDKLMQQTFGTKEHTFQESPMTNQWLELFRTGDYGDKGNFTNSDLDQIVRNFDPSFHEAPVVIGHPRHDAPAYAWVEGLKRGGETLLGKFKQIDPKFEEMVKTGRFKKRSISLYRTAKGWMLRHVGYLGARPPEVKGLANATFAEDRSHCVDGIFGDSETRADAIIADLKDRGYWTKQFDRCGVPVLFRELEGNPLLGQMVVFIERLMNECDATSTLLSERAGYFARAHGVSFGEALSQVAKGSVSQAQREDELRTANQAVSHHALSGKLAKLAWDRVKSTGVTFKQALAEVAAEYPELQKDSPEMGYAAYWPTGESNS